MLRGGLLALLGAALCLATGSGQVAMAAETGLPLKCLSDNFMPPPTSVGGIDAAGFSRRCKQDFWVGSKYGASPARQAELASSEARPHGDGALRAWLWDGRFPLPQDSTGRILKPSPCKALVVADTVAHDDATTRQLVLTLRRLGYEEDDIFVYRGTTWTQPSGNDVSYRSTLSPQEELASEGRWLRRAVDDIRAEHGDVCFDIVSHSLGGIAARLYLQGQHYLPGSVRSFFSSGTAHRGSDMAVARDVVQAISGQDGTTRVRRLVLDVAAALDRPDLERFDPAGPVAEAMHPNSPLLQDLAHRPFPAKVRIFTVQGAWNIIVLHGRGHLSGGRAIFVDAQHDEPWDEDFAYILYNSLAGREGLHIKSQLLSLAAALYHGLVIRPLEFGCAVLVGIEPYTERQWGVGFLNLVLWLVAHVGGL